MNPSAAPHGGKSRRRTTSGGFLAAQTSRESHRKLVAGLEQQGDAAAEVDGLLAKVAQYDAQTLRELVFDARARGEFNPASLISQPKA